MAKLAIKDILIFIYFINGSKLLKYLKRARFVYCKFKTLRSTALKVRCKQ